MPARWPQPIRPCTNTTGSSWLLGQVWSAAAAGKTHRLAARMSVSSRHRNRLLCFIMFSLQSISVFMLSYHHKSSQTPPNDVKRTKVGELRLCMLKACFCASRTVAAYYSNVLQRSYNASGLRKFSNCVTRQACVRKSREGYFCIFVRHHSQKFINSVFGFGKFYEFGHSLANCIKTASAHCEDLDSFAHIRYSIARGRLI